MEEGLALFARHGRPRSWDTNFVVMLAWIATYAGDFACARSASHQVLADSSGTERFSLSHAHGILGLVALHEGGRDAAAAHFAELLAHARSMAARGQIKEGLYGAAAVATIDGCNERAVRLWSAADGIEQGITGPPHAGEHPARLG